MQRTTTCVQPSEMACRKGTASNTAPSTSRRPLRGWCISESRSEPKCDRATEVQRKALLENSAARVKVVAKLGGQMAATHLCASGCPAITGMLALAFRHTARSSLSVKFCSTGTVLTMCART